MSDIGDLFSQRLSSAHLEDSSADEAVARAVRGARRRRRGRQAAIGGSFVAVAAVMVGIVVSQRPESPPVEIGAGNVSIPPSVGPGAQDVQSEPPSASDGPRTVTWAPVQATSAPVLATATSASGPIALLANGDISVFDAGTGTWGNLATTGFRTGSVFLAVGDREVFVWGGATGQAEATEDGLLVQIPNGQVSAVPESPLGGRFRASAVWTGEEVLVWGGLDAGGTPRSDGAAFDPVEGTWSVLPDGPLSPRNDHHAVWSGTEMIVWGGCADTQNPVQCDDFTTGGELVDGAAFNPLTQSWRPIAGSSFSGRDKSEVTIQVR